MSPNEIAAANEHVYAPVRFLAHRAHRWVIVDDEDDGWHLGHDEAPPGDRAGN